MPTGKSRHYRVYDPEYYHEVSQRVRKGEFLLDPNCPTLKAAILGQLADALDRYDVQLIGLQFMTDHFHAIYATDCPYNLAKFFAYFHSGITLAYNRLRAAESPEEDVEPVSLWCDMRWLPVTRDEASVRWRLRYLMGQAVAAGLVDHPIQFPATSTIDAMIDGKPMMGKIYNATKKYRDSRLKAGALPDKAYEAEVEVKLTPPSCWAHLPPEELRQRYMEVADSVAKVPLAQLRRGKVQVPVEPTRGREDPFAKQPVEPDPAGRADELPALDPDPMELDPQPSAAHDPGPCQVAADSQEFSEALDGKVHIPPRLDEFGKPFKAGRVKPKPNYYTAGGRRKKRPLILSVSASVREAYEDAYNQWVDAYMAAKERYREAIAVTTTGLGAPPLAIPPNMMLGSMPYPKTRKLAANP